MATVAVSPLISFHSASADSLSIEDLLYHINTNHTLREIRPPNLSFPLSRRLGPTRSTGAFEDNR